MRSICMVAALAVVMAFGSSCAKKATPAECKAACQNRAGFIKPAKPAEDPVKKVEADFAARLKALQKEQLDAVTVIDKELQEKLAEATNDGAKKALEQEYKAKKSEKAKTFAPRFTELNKQKADAINAAREAKAKAEAAVKEAAEKVLVSCADKCVRDRVTKARADCWIKAKNLEDYGKCK
ncbi:MAG: hypothetical protein GXP54_03910 [Deltaproteobacteria bacterium]|nr:hypothetical protein [Deltaproteobacteria bacterium]